MGRRQPGDRAAEAVIGGRVVERPADLDPGALARAATLHRVGVAEHNSGRPAVALRTLHRAAALVGGADPGSAEEVLAARIWISLALDELEVGGAPAGRAALARAGELAAAVGEPEIDGLLHCQRGLIEFRIGNLGAARESLDAAAGLLGHLGLREQASVMINRGTIALIERRLADARRDLGAGADIARRADRPVEAFKSLHNLAYLEFLSGDLPSSLRLMDEAAAIDAPVSRGVWFLDRAQVLAEAGLLREAEDALGEAAGTFRRDRLRQDLAETQLEIARCALASGAADRARVRAAAARAIFARRGNAVQADLALIVQLQAELAAGSRRRGIGSRAAELAGSLRVAGLRLSARAAGLLAVESWLVAGRIPAAVAELERLGEPGRSDPITGRLHSHYVHARADAALGDTARARARVRRGLEELARYRASFGSLDLRTASAVHGRRLVELDAELALASGRPRAVFDAAERGRAVSSRLPPVRPPDDHEAAYLLSELRQTLEALRATGGNHAQTESLLATRRELERRVVARSWLLPGEGRPARPAALVDVQDELRGSGLQLAHYQQIGATLVALSVGARASLVRLGPAAPVIETVRRVRADLDVAARPGLPAPIRAAVTGSLARGLRRLDDALLAPLRVDGPLVVVSTGSLSGLPWGSLPSLRGVPVTVAPSATKWLACSRGRRPAAPRVVAVAGPDVSRGEDEAREVASAWAGASTLIGAAASPQAFVAATGAADVLHVAAHGFHQPDSPLFSSLRLAGGSVFAHELTEAPAHVVLSACQVGLATIRPGDEALGLASALLHLGARSVVAAVALVGDDAAAAVSSAYHRELAGGAASDEALASALVTASDGTPVPFVNFGAGW